MSSQPLIPALSLSTRRGALIRITGAAAALGCTSSIFAAGRALRIGTTLDNSGVEKANGSGLHAGAMAYFDAVNRAGGVNGAKLELLLADDQFNPDRARRNALAFDADPSVIAMLHPLGTRQTAAVIESISDMAVVGPSTGTTGLRKKSGANVFWVRTTYDQEIEKLVATAVTLGMGNIGMVYPNDPLGQSLLAAFKASMSKFNLKPGVIATTPNTTSPDVDAAAQQLAAAAPQIVIMGLAGTAVAFVRALRKAGGTSTVYGLSIGASAANISALGEQARGLAFSIVVPSPFASKNEVVRSYRAHMQAHGSTEYSLPSLEGYINARVLVESLRRAGANPTRESVMAALGRLDVLDLGGLRVGFGKGKREGCNFVDLAVIGARSRMLA